MEVQGHHCRGTGGPKGVQVAFHPGGALKQYFPVRPMRIDGVPCDMGLVRGWIELHEDGRLKSCRLAEDFARDGETFRKGAGCDRTESALGETALGRSISHLAPVRVRFP